MVMEFKFSKDSGDIEQYKAPDEKKRQTALLILLLVLVGGFAYLYFFTDLIRPLETQKSSEIAAPAPQMVKIPLPARAGEPEKVDVKKGAGAETPKAAVIAAGPVPAPVAVPAAPPVAAPVIPAPKPAPAPVMAKPIPEAKKIEAPKPPTKTKQPAVAEKPVNKKAVAKDKVQTKAVAKKKTTVPSFWTLAVGNFVLEEKLSTDMGHVRKAGLEPVVKPSVQKKSAMNRLFVAEFNDRAAVQPTLDKLKRQTSDAFVIQQGSRFVLYAGSYLHKDAAVTERDRLKAVGIAVTIRQTDIGIPSRNLSVGPFKSKNEAEQARARLKTAGIKATLSHK